MGEWMQAKEVAALYEVDVATVYRWAQTGQLAAYRVGKRYRFKRLDVAAFLAKVEPSALPPFQYRPGDIDATVEELRRRGYDL